MVKFLDWVAIVIIALFWLALIQHYARYFYRKFFEPDKPPYRSRWEIYRDKHMPKKDLPSETAKKKEE